MKIVAGVTPGWQQATVFLDEQKMTRVTECVTGENGYVDVIVSVDAIWLGPNSSTVRIPGQVRVEHL